MDGCGVTGALVFRQIIGTLLKGGKRGVGLLPEPSSSLGMLLTDWPREMREARDPAHSRQEPLRGKFRYRTGGRRERSPQWSRNTPEFLRGAVCVSGLQAVRGQN